MKLIIIFIASAILISCGRVNSTESSSEYTKAIDSTEFELTCGTIDTLDSKYIHYECNGYLIDAPEIKRKGDFVYDMELDTLLAWKDSIYSANGLLRKAHWNIIPSEPYEDGNNPYLNMEIFYDDNGDTVHRKSKYANITTLSEGDTLYLNINYVDMNISDTNSSYILQLISERDSTYRKSFRTSEFKVKFNLFEVFGEDTGLLKLWIHHNRPNLDDSTRMYQEIYTNTLELKN